MQITKLDVCRGNWKIFQKLRIEGLSPSSCLEIKADGCGHNMAPALLLKADSSTPDEYVLIAPDFNVKESVYAIIDTAAHKDGKEQARVSINHAMSKWASRATYRLNKELSKSLRDFDEVAEFYKATVNFYDCIEDGDSLIIRCGVLTPSRNDTNIEIICKDEQGKTLDIVTIPFGQNETPTDFTLEKRVLESQYSIKIPSNHQRYYFFLSDSNHPSFNSFDCLTPERLKLLREDSNYLFRSAQFDPFYDKWLKEHRATQGVLQKQRTVVFARNVLFSIIVPLYNTPLQLFEEMVDSVTQQTYSNWELVLVNASPDYAELDELIKVKTAADKRIRCIQLEANKGISENTNAGINASAGDYICFFDHDDTLEPDLLFSYAEAIDRDSEIDLLYCDEDKLMPDGTYTQPFFKPDFNLDLLRNNNYICHMLTIRKELLDQLEPNSKEYDGAQDHNLTLRAVEKTNHIHHVPKVLYHWRITESSTAADAASKPYASLAGIKAVQEHLDRSGIKATVEQAKRPFTYKVTYAVPEDRPLVSIIIPTKDHIDLLSVCLNSIIQRSTYTNFEVLVVENNSSEAKTFDYYKEIEAQGDGKIRIITWPNEFNFSKIMNYASKHAKGDYLLLLNNDTEVITPNWIEIMLGLCSRKDVGAVGVKLYYPDETIQHAGICIGGGVAGHLCLNLPKNNWGYFALNDAQQDLSAVTAACMMTKKSVFDSVGGFTEELQVAFNDVDYCLKIRERDLLVVYTPEVELYHYESISRGQENNVEKKMRFHREVSYMNYRWARYYVEGDPYMNPNFASGEPLNRYYHL